MYCVNCGVKLADTEKVCPLCNTVVYHPDLQRAEARPLYPYNRRPKLRSGSKALCGVVLFLFFIPILVTFLADLQLDRSLDWFFYALGALLLAYITVALPLWLKKPNPVIFVPCSFAGAALYLLYINFATGGSWFLTFALPVTGGFCLIATTVVTLLRYVRGGRFYILGGAAMGLGGFMLPVEILLTVTFPLSFIGWSIYPMVGLLLIGGALIFLGINSSARAVMARKMFI